MYTLLFQSSFYVWKVCNKKEEKVIYKNVGNRAKSISMVKFLAIFFRNHSEFNCNITWHFYWLVLHLKNSTVKSKTHCAIHQFKINEQRLDVTGHTNINIKQYTAITWSAFAIEWANFLGWVYKLSGRIRWIIVIWLFKDFIWIIYPNYIPFICVWLIIYFGNHYYCLLIARLVFYFCWVHLLNICFLYGYSHGSHFFSFFNKDWRLGWWWRFKCDHFIRFGNSQ